MQTIQIKHLLVVGMLLLTAACHPIVISTIPAPSSANGDTVPVAMERDVDFAPLVAVIDQEMAAQQVPGLAIAITQYGVPLFQQGFGVTDLTTQQPVTPATLFRIASLTKPLTAIALLQLVEAGKVELDAPVVSYLPEFAVSDQITLRHLLSHSSGLGDAAISYGRTDAAALQDYVAALTPASAFAPPGEVFSYSNPGFNTVGRIIEVVTGMEYAKHMEGHVFPALGMPRSTFDRERALVEGLALGHFPAPEGPAVVERDANYAAEFPSGYVFSNVEEMSRLAIFLLSDGLVEGTQILSPANVQAMKTPVIPVDSLGSGYGLGVALGTTAGKATIGHTGNIPGYSATLVAIPDHELAVIVLANRNVVNLSPILDAAFALFVEPVSIPPMPEITLDEATLAEYAGRYQMMHVFENDESMIVTIVADAGTLKADVPGITFEFTLELRPLGNDLFNVYAPQMTTPATQIAFSRDTTGMIRYMNFSSRALLRVEE